jgi:soluble lytic murein transglycosylase
VKLRAKILVGVCWALLAAPGPEAARAAPQVVPERLRTLAAGAGERSVWPELRRYASSRTDPQERSLAYLCLGYREYDAGEFEAAAQDLGQAATPQFFLADYAAYYAASAASKTGNPAQAAALLRDFASNFPESQFRLQAVELLGQALIESQQQQAAVQALTGEPRVHQHANTSLVLAKAYAATGDSAQAAREFEQVYYAFPASPQAVEAGAALAGLRAHLGEEFPQPTEEIETARLELLFKASQVKEALQGYDGLLAARPASAHAEEWRLGRARCLVRLRRDSEAARELAASLSTPALNAERLELKVEAAARDDNTAATLAALTELESLDAHSPSYESALYTAGNLFFRLEDWQNAGRQYQTLVETFPQGGHAPEARWRLVWCYYFGGEAEQAGQALRAYLAESTRPSHTAAAIYWLGRLEEKQADLRDAQALYALLASRFPHSYYADQANARLKKLPAGRSAGAPEPTSLAMELAQKIPPRGPSPVPACGAEAGGETLTPVRTLEALHLEELAEQYARAMLAARPAQPEMHLYLSKMEAAQGNVGAALFEAGRAAPDYTSYEFSELPREIWTLLYPRSYWTIVERQARANRLDPYLVMGLIRQESAFSPRATSAANARGLMQVLPKTASRSTRASRIRSTGARLYDANYNVRFGCAYLRTLLKDFDDQPELALAAYNAGDYRVRTWQKGYAFHDPSEFLEAIPFRETRGYVEAVLRDAAIYRQMLGGKAKFAACGR